MAEEQAKTCGPSDLRRAGFEVLEKNLTIVMLTW